MGEVGSNFLVSQERLWITKSFGERDKFIGKSWCKDVVKKGLHQRGASKPPNRRNKVNPIGLRNKGLVFFYVFFISEMNKLVFVEVYNVDLLV